MKYILILLTTIGLSSCTTRFSADLDVKCPCYVTKIAVKSSYQKKINEITVEDNRGYDFTFSTYNYGYYNIGDTIK